MSRYVAFPLECFLSSLPNRTLQDFCEMGDLTAWATHLGENRMKLVAVELVRPP